MRRSVRERGFSLVEILAVISIMSILAVVTISSFSSLRSTSLTLAGNQIADVFAQARQNSITRNAYTAVVIKAQGAGAYNAYCLMELKQQDDGSWGAWTEIAPWHFLGQGLAFENGQASDTFVSTAVNLPVALPAQFSFQGQPINLTSVSVYQCYQPDGTLLGGQNPPLRLRLVQGSVDPSTGAIAYQGPMASGKAINYYDLIFVGNTGVAKIERP